MTKISKTVKNANPEVYGFEHPYDIPGNTKEKITVWCIDFIDADGDKRWCVCSEEYYKWEMNQRREERRRIDELTRCMVSSQKYGLVKCRKDCNKCPFKKRIDKSTGTVYYEQYERTGGMVSLDFLEEEYEYEFPDSKEDEEYDDDLNVQINYYVSLLDDESKTIIELFKEGLSDSKIAEKMNSKKSTIQYKRIKIFEDLRKKIKK